MAHEARTTLPLSTLNRVNLQGQEERAELVLSTDKSFSGGITSTANVQFVREGIITFELCGDFRATLLQDRSARATQKAIFAQHGRVFTAQVIADLTEKVTVFYAAKQGSS